MAVVNTATNTHTHTHTHTHTTENGVLTGNSPAPEAVCTLRVNIPLLRVNLMSSLSYAYPAVHEFSIPISP